MMRCFLAMLCICGVSFGGELEDAKKSLVGMREAISFIRSNGLHVQDEGRIRLIDRSVAGVQQSLEKNGLLSLVTFNSYKAMEVRFRFSVLFFQFIRTTRTERTIVKLLETVAEIREKLQLEKDPYNKILKSNLSQLREIAQALKKAPNIPEKLHQELTRLLPNIGEAEVIADDGDRPLAFKAASRIYHEIRSLYPLLQDMPSKSGYGLASEMMGLNEFLGEYCQEEVEKP